MSKQQDLWADTKPTATTAAVILGLDVPELYLLALAIPVLILVIPPVHVNNH